ncbi:MAG: D-alanyl-D-alanine carboxypeptidase/D-alanyl-D-alanine-endopeptidase [Cyanobacteria bacterium SIG29]|nr:D-alanyl-D-alanine carboxypeptidase/D-alanyl-D-alanine-endopeptidase [Cyanobacteria bacterium SIG29]
MKNLFKILTLIMVFMFTVNSSFAFPVSKLDKLVKKSSLDEKSTLAISIRNVSDGSVVYEQNSKKLLHPASSLKIFTTYSSLNMLGSDYQFKTQFLKDNENNLYIKLGADPLLTSSQLNLAFHKLRESGNTKFNNIYFDDSILDKKEMATGWMWDDEINPYTPKVSSYNLDSNVVTVEMLQEDNGRIYTELKSTYPMSIVSNIELNNKKDFIQINRYNWTSPEVVEIYASVVKPRSLEIPISSMRRYFIHNVEKAMEQNRITTSGVLYASKITPDNVTLLTEITNPIENTLPEILHKSNNLMAETLFKLSGAYKYNATGSDILGSVAFKEFYKKNGVSTDDVVIKDGCGVSRNNLFSVDWMTSTLNKISKEKDFDSYKELMAQPGDGTLLNRLLDLRGDVRLKTGSLSNISAISGYVKSQDGNTYSVAIILQNFTQEQREIKDFENKIIELIYSR